VCDIVVEYLKQPSVPQTHFTLQTLRNDEKLLPILNEALKVLHITTRIFKNLKFKKLSRD